MSDAVSGPSHSTTPSSGPQRSLTERQLQTHPAQTEACWEGALRRFKEHRMGQVEGLLLCPALGCMSSHKRAAGPSRPRQEAYVSSFRKTMACVRASLIPSWCMLAAPGAASVFWPGISSKGVFHFLLLSAACFLCLILTAQFTCLPRSTANGESHLPLSLSFSPSFCLSLFLLPRSTSVAL